MKYEIRAEAIRTNPMTSAFLSCSFMLAPPPQGIERSIGEEQTDKYQRQIEDDVGCADNTREELVQMIENRKIRQNRLDAFSGAPPKRIDRPEHQNNAIGDARRPNLVLRQCRDEHSD